MKRFIGIVSILLLTLIILSGCNTVPPEDNTAPLKNNTVSLEKKIIFPKDKSTSNISFFSEILTWYHSPSILFT